METKLRIEDFNGIVRRQKWVSLAIFSTVVLLCTLVALALPSIYRSETTILIEGQKIPEEYIKSTIASYIDERLKLMTQKIMSRSKLSPIIKKYDPYPEMAKNGEDTLSKMVEKLKSNIKLQTMSAGQEYGQNNNATVSFKLLFNDRDPKKAQLIAQELAQLYINEDIRTKEKLSSITTDILESELSRLKENIDLQEKKISEFKMAHIGELPEYERVVFDSIERGEREIDNIENNIRMINERKIYLRGQIATIEPMTPIPAEDGGMMANPAEALKGLRLKLLSMKASLSPKHPDIINLEKSIHKLEEQAGETDATHEKIKRLKALKTEVVKMKGKLGEKHPEIIRMSREIVLLSGEVDGLLNKQSDMKPDAEEPDNPTYINLMTQIVNSDIEIQGLVEQKAQVRARMERDIQKSENIPLVEEEYKGLMLNYENAARKYTEFQNKLMEARLARKMEMTQQGEKFTILDPASFPMKPYKPNRLRIILLGFVLGIGMSILFAAFKEGMNNSIKTAEEVSELTGIPVIATIPFLKSKKENGDHKRRIAFVSFVAALAVGIILLVVYHFAFSIDSLLLKMQQSVAAQALSTWG